MAGSCGELNRLAHRAHVPEELRPESLVKTCKLLFVPPVPVTCYLLFATCYFLLTTYYLLLATCYLLLATCYLLLATCYLLIANC